MLITELRQVTPKLLTAIFRANGFLSEREVVTKVQIEDSTESGVAQHHRASLRYADFQTQRHAPERIFIKLNKSSQQMPLAEREVTFYNEVMPPMLKRHTLEALRLPRCYDAYYDDIAGGSHILLQDLGKEFRPHSKPQPPTQRHQEQIMDSLALFHAFWWEHDKLGELGTLPTEESLAENQARYQERFEAFYAFAGEKLNPVLMDALQQVVSKTPDKRRERLLAGQGLTLVHRDLHPGNFLYSHKDTRIMDWQSWRVDTATDDLAYMMAFYWPEPLRRFHEQNLLRRYHDALLRNGVQNYSWDDLQYDYRASIARALSFLLVAWKPERHQHDWKRIETGLNAFLKLDGREIYS